MVVKPIHHPLLVGLNDPGYDDDVTYGRVVVLQVNGRVVVEVLGRVVLVVQVFGPVVLVVQVFGRAVLVVQVFGLVVGLVVVVGRGVEGVTSSRDSNAIWSERWAIICIATGR